MFASIVSQSVRCRRACGTAISVADSGCVKHVKHLLVHLWPLAEGLRKHPLLQAWVAQIALSVPLIGEALLTPTICLRDYRQSQTCAIENGFVVSGSTILQESCRCVHSIGCGLAITHGQTHQPVRTWHLLLYSDSPPHYAKTAQVHYTVATLFTTYMLLSNTITMTRLGQRGTGQGTRNMTC